LSFAGNVHSHGTTRRALNPRRRTARSRSRTAANGLGEIHRGYTVEAVRERLDMGGHLVVGNEPAAKPAPPGANVP